MAKPRNRWIVLSGLVFQMGAIIGGFTYAGFRIDMRRVHSSHPVFTIVLSLTGVAIALYVAIKEVSKLSDEE